MNQGNPNQLFLGTYRLYRTDNAKAPSAGDVNWHAISPDLTTGCTGAAPNGARGCFLSAARCLRRRRRRLHRHPRRLGLVSPTPSPAQPDLDPVGKASFPNRPSAISRSTGSN